MPYRTSLDWESGPGYSIVTNTGHDSQVIFRSREDFRHFMLLIRRGLHKSPDVSVLAYSLLRPSFTILLHEKKPGEIVKFMHRLSVSYATYFNSRYSKRGKVFRGPYKDTSVASDDQIMRALCEVHMLPAKEGQPIESYEWSSYRHYLKGTGTWLDKTYPVAYFAKTIYADDLRQMTRIAYRE